MVSSDATEKPSTLATVLTRCPACGKENQPHYKFCLGCGADIAIAATPAAAVDLTPQPRVATATARCASCGKDNPPHYEFCMGCGADLARAASAVQQPRSAGIVKCYNCGGTTTADLRACANCGSPLAGAKPTGRGPPKALAMVAGLLVLILAAVGFLLARGQ